MLKPDSALDKDRRTAKYVGAEALQHRHYAFIASVIAAMPKHAPSLRTQRESCAAAFADACAANPRFDRRRFMAACGLEG